MADASNAELDEAVEQSASTNQEQYRGEHGNLDKAAAEHQ